jgi:regulatory protein
VARRSAKSSSARDTAYDPAGSAGSADRDADADPVEVAKKILLAQLSSSAKSRRQLEQVLARKLVPADAAANALDRFSELGYIDDEAFARSWVQSRQRSRGLAASAVRRELYQKGIASETIATVIADEIDVESERDIARSLVDKKLRSMRSLDADVATRRLVSMLARKGYSPSLAYTVVRDAINSTPLG